VHDAVECEGVECKQLGQLSGMLFFSQRLCCTKKIADSRSANYPLQFNGIASYSIILTIIHASISSMTTSSASLMQRFKGWWASVFQALFTSNVFGNEMRVIMGT
jgi:hypothetical protein